MNKKITIAMLVLLGIGSSFFIPEELTEQGYKFYDCNEENGMLCWKLSGGKHTWCYDNIEEPKSHTICSTGWTLYEQEIIGEETNIESINKHKWVEKDKKEAKKKQKELDDKKKEDLEKANTKWHNVSKGVYDLEDNYWVDIYFEYTYNEVRYSETLLFKMPVKQSNNSFIESRVNNEVRLRIPEDKVYYETT